MKKPTRIMLKRSVFALSVFSLPFVLFSIFYFLNSNTASAQTCQPGQSCAAINTNSMRNVAVGTSTPTLETKFLIVASSTDTSNFALKILQPSASPILLVRNDGSIIVGTSTPAGANLYAQGNIATAGNFQGNLAASYVTSGVFGSGNFAVNGSLGVATTTQVGLPQSLSVYGGGYFSGNVGIGTTGPSGLLDVGGGKLVVTSGGNVGIGTTNPNTRLHIQGAGFSSPLLQLTTTGTGNREFQAAITGGGANFDTLYIRSNTVSGGGTFADLMSINAGGNVGIGYDASLATGKLTINGNVGIGTTGPGQPLQLGSGTFQKDAYMKFQTGAASGSPGRDWTIGIPYHATDITGEYYDFVIKDGSTTKFQIDWNTGNVMLAPTGGNVGIGTTNPATALEVNGGIRYTPAPLPTGVEGEVRYNSATHRLAYRNESKWVEIDPLYSSTAATYLNVPYGGGNWAGPSSGAWYIGTVCSTRCNIYYGADDLVFDTNGDQWSDWSISLPYGLCITLNQELTYPGEVQSLLGCIHIWYRSQI
jgi:hypothetical protein